MSVKFYNIVWLFFLGIVGICFLSGNLTPVVGVVIGFVAFGWVFMGMMVVLTTSIHHTAPVVSGGRMFLRRLRDIFQKAEGRFHDWRAAWMSSSSIEVRRPRLH